MDSAHPSLAWVLGGEPPIRYGHEQQPPVIAEFGNHLTEFINAEKGLGRQVLASLEPPAAAREQDEPATANQRNRTGGDRLQQRLGREEFGFVDRPNLRLCSWRLSHPETGARGREYVKALRKLFDAHLCRRVRPWLRLRPSASHRFRCALFGCVRKFGNIFITYNLLR